MKKKRNAPDYIVFFTAVTLLAIGVIMSLVQVHYGCRDGRCLLLFKRQAWAGLV